MSTEGGAQRQPQSKPEDKGYCVTCGEWGLGRYKGPLNSHSDSITDHRGCNGEPPAGIQSRHVGGR
nr:hypothetical protein KPHV_61040 [Kitasatospora purpeofusca]